MGILNNDKIQLDPGCLLLAAGFQHNSKKDDFYRVWDGHLCHLIIDIHIFEGGVLGVEISFFDYNRLDSKKFTESFRDIERAMKWMKYISTGLIHDFGF